VDVGHAAGGLQLLLGGLQPGVLQVRADRVVEQVRLLRHHADGVGEGGESQVAEIVAVDANGALGGVVQAGDQIGEGGLARPAGAHQRHQLAWLGREAYRIQRDAARLAARPGGLR